MNLERLGATPELRASLAPGLSLARVTVSNRDRYRLIADSGELDAEPSGALWYGAATRAAMPVVGDWVGARIINREQAIVEAVLPRRTLFSRRAAGRREDQQPIAANIDLVFLVCGLDGDFNLRRLERYLTLAAESGADAVVVLNKCDLCDGSCRRDWRRPRKSPGRRRWWRCIRGVRRGSSRCFGFLRRGARWRCWGRRGWANLRW